MMHPILIEVLSAISMAFGMTALTVFTSRTESDKKLVLATFLSGIIIVFGLLHFPDLPEGTEVWLGIVGLLMGIVSSLGLYVAISFEKSQSR